MDDPLRPQPPSSHVAREGTHGVKARRWWAWLADGAVVVMGGLAAAVLIIGLGWGRYEGWRLIAAAAVGLVVATVVCELPSGVTRGAGGPVPRDVRQPTEGPDAGPHG